MILKTRARRFAVNFDVAGAQLEGSVDHVDGLARHAGRQERSEVERAVFLNPPRDHDFGKRLVDGQFQMRIRLVVFQIDVVARLMFFGERRFKDQGFDFVVGDDELDVGDLSDQRVGLAIETAAPLKIRTHAAAQVLGLADIDDFAGAVFVQIDAG